VAEAHGDALDLRSPGSRVIADIADIGKGGTGLPEMDASYVSGQKF
jgi:hypothetical protein